MNKWIQERKSIEEGGDKKEEKKDDKVKEETEKEEEETNESHKELFESELKFCDVDSFTDQGNYSIMTISWPLKLAAKIIISLQTIDYIH